MFIFGCPLFPFILADSVTLNNVFLSKKDPLGSSFFLPPDGYSWFSFFYSKDPSLCWLWNILWLT